MADFLSNDWFDALNATLASAGPVPFEGGERVFRVVLEFPDAPSSGPHAMTFTLANEGATVQPGDHLAADAIVRLSYVDATSLTNGSIDSASALRRAAIANWPRMVSRS